MGLSKDMRQRCPGSLIWVVLLNQRRDSRVDISQGHSGVRSGYAEMGRPLNLSVLRHHGEAANPEMLAWIKQLFEHVLGSNSCLIRQPGTVALRLGHGFLLVGHSSFDNFLDC